MVKAVLCLLMASVASLAMATTEVSLNGTWRLDYWPQPDRGAVRTLDLPEHETVDATVPGNCELDLIRAGRAESPFVGFDALKLRKWEGYQWLYTREFEATPCDGGDGSVAELVFGGIDLFADIFLNGEKIGESENMLIERRFDVTGRLRKGRNVLQVLLRSTLLECSRFTIGEIGYHQDNAEREPIRKAAYMGGWDIFQRGFYSGLWRDVKLVYRDPVRLENVVWIFGGVNLERRTASFKVQYRAKAPMRALMLDHRLRVRLSRNGETRFLAERQFRTTQGSMVFGGRDGLKDAEFWWPRGMGEPALYDATLEVVDPDGRVLARDARRVGVRSITLESRDITSERPGEFLFRVNGKPCFIRGSNWVPLDPFPSRHREHLAEALDLWRDLNCNMVRVWGGGVYEPHEFFDFCDENGIMVWQDFMTGCTAYPQDDAYAKLTEEEVKQVVLEFRNHASLALWSGNNENDNAILWYSFPEHRRNCNRDRLSRRIIPDILWEFDITRPYLPSSPYRSEAVVAGQATNPEEHHWGVSRLDYKHAQITNTAAYFVSETGWHGCPGRAALERMMSKACVYPWTEIRNGGKDPFRDFTFNEEWQFKASNPFRDPENTWGLERNYNMTRLVWNRFHAVPQELDAFVEASQLVQAEAHKTLMEIFRSKKFAGKNGLIWWNMKDGGPVISDAVVDYWFGKKLAYWAIRNVQRDHLVLVRDDRLAVAVNDTLVPVKGHVRITDHASGVVLMEKDYEVPANGKLDLGRVAWSGRGLLDIEYEQAGVARYNWFLYGEPPFDLGVTIDWLRTAYKRIR